MHKLNRKYFKNVKMSAILVWASQELKKNWCRLNLVEFLLNIHKTFCHIINYSILIDLACSKIHVHV